MFNRWGVYSVSDVLIIKCSEHWFKRSALSVAEDMNLIAFHHSIRDYPNRVRYRYEVRRLNDNT